jgi:nitroreductase
MTVLETIKNRYSVRDFKEIPVEKEKLDQILEAARYAPSACNIQPCSCIIVQDSIQKQRLRPAYNREWFIAAPVIIGVCVDVKSAWRRVDGVSYGFVDAAIFMDHIILAATELGLGTCWIGSFKIQEAQKALELPDHIQPVVFSPLGYPNQEMPKRKRKGIGDLMHFERMK